MTTPPSIAITAFSLFTLILIVWATDIICALDNAEQLDKARHRSVDSICKTAAGMTRNELITKFRWPDTPNSKTQTEVCLFGKNEEQYWIYEFPDNTGAYLTFSGEKCVSCVPVEQFRLMDSQRKLRTH